MTDDAPNFLSLAEFARLHRVSKPTVTNWKARGYVVLKDGKVDVVASNKILADRPKGRAGGVAKVRPGKPAEPPLPEGAGGEPHTWSRLEAQRQREIAQAQLARIEAEKAAGLVVLKSEVAATVRAEYTIVRTAALGLASKLAHRLAAATTPEQCGALVDAEVRALLSALTADGGAA
jgi:hypothetical protein